MNTTINHRFINHSKLLCLTATILAANMIMTEACAGQTEDKANKLQPIGQAERHNHMQQNSKAQQLTPELLSKVAAILSQYSPSSLSAADAKAINNGFRKAGVRRGPGQPEAIKAAGFDPEKIRALDPPPEPRSEKNK